MTHPHIERVQELFKKLKTGHDWIMRHEDDTDQVQGLLDRSKVIVDELERLGVSRGFSTTLLIFGPLVTKSLVQQFEEGY